MTWARCVGNSDVGIARDRMISRRLFPDKGAYVAVRTASPVVRMRRMKVGLPSGSERDYERDRRRRQCPPKPTGRPLAVWNRGYMESDVCFQGFSG